MKKFVVCIIAISVVIFLKNITTTKYSNDDIVALINKGIDNMDNISFDEESKYGTTNYYFKGNNKKIIDPNFIHINQENDGNYLLDVNGKRLPISPSINIYSIPQYAALVRQELNNDYRYKDKDKFRYEFVYVKDDKLENKDCIFVRECVFVIENKEYIDYLDMSKDKIPVYWIEKSTGFIIGSGFMDPGKDKATPETIIKNIKCGEVTDDMFEMPNNYKLLN